MMSTDVNSMIEALSVVLQDVMQANINTDHLHQCQRQQQAHMSQKIQVDSESAFAGLRSTSAVNGGGASGITGKYDEPSLVMANVPTKFDSAYAPAVSLVQYLSRIHTYAKCSDSCFVVALIYIDRIIAMHSFRVTALNVHRIFLASILLSAKFLDDIYYNNSFYAKLGGISLQELNALELEFLRLTRFDLNVSEEQYGAYHASIRAYACRTSSNRPAQLIGHNHDRLYAHNMSCGNDYLMTGMDMQWQQQKQQAVLGAYAYTSPVPMHSNHVHVVSPPSNNLRFIYNKDSVLDMYNGNNNAILQHHCIGYEEPADGALDANGNFVQDAQKQQQPQLQHPSGSQAQQWWEDGQGQGQGQVNQISNSDVNLQHVSYAWNNGEGAAGYGYIDPTRQYTVYPILPMYPSPSWRSAVAATI
jgi:hypothetical protein